MDIFSKLQTNIDTALATYVFDVSTSVIEWLAPIFANLLIIYIALYGYAHFQGVIAEPLTDAFKRVIRIGVILQLALNVVEYNQVIVDFLFNGADQIASVVTGAAPTVSVLDNLITQGMDIGDRAWAKGGVIRGDIGQYLIAFIIYLIVGLFAAYAAFLMLMSKVGLALLLAIGPIFIAAVLFKTTQRFFEAWVGITINFAFLLILAVAAVKLILGIIDSGLNAVHSSNVTEIASMITVLVLVFISGLVLRQVPSIAASLGGGLALATQNAFSSMLNRTGRVTWRGMKGTAQGVNRTYLAGKNLYRKTYGNRIVGS